MDALNRQDLRNGRKAWGDERGDDKEETRKMKRVKRGPTPPSDESSDAREAVSLMPTVTLLREMAIMLEELQRREGRCLDSPRCSST